MQTTKVFHEYQIILIYVFVVPGPFPWHFGEFRESRLLAGVNWGFLQNEVELQNAYFGPQYPLQCAE